MKKKNHHRARPMPAEALREWREKMQLTQTNAAALLGMSKVALSRAEHNGAPLYIAYACAALADGSKPWGIRKDALHQYRSERKIDGRHVELKALEAAA